MATVGLLYVGAVLFINGLILLGPIEPRAGGVFNLFVGTMQVVTPTFIIFTAAGDPAKIFAASGLYLFGFTYLYVGIGLLGGLDSTGVGYFSLFVAIMALGYSWANFALFNDKPFGVIWLYWSFLWALFFVLLGLKKVAVNAYTGFVAAVEGWVTGAIPAFLMLTGYWQGWNQNLIAIGLGIVAVLMVLIFLPTLRRPVSTEPVSVRSAGEAPAT